MVVLSIKITSGSVIILAIDKNNKVIDATKEDLKNVINIGELEKIPNVRYEKGVYVSNAYGYMMLWQTKDGECQANTYKCNKLKPVAIMVKETKEVFNLLEV